METTEWDGMDGAVVTVVDTADVRRFLGVEKNGLRRRLRELRDQGLLVHDPKRLTKRRRVRDDNAKHGVRHVRCVVFKCAAADVPKVPNPERGRMRVILA
jgi:hypothetical protein